MLYVKYFSCSTSCRTTRRKSEQISPYTNVDSYWTKLSFPVKLQEIFKFERLNNISVNVYGPLYFTSNRVDNKHVNLLLICDEHGRSHYTYIQNLSRLVGSQLSKHRHLKHLCDGGLCYSLSIEILRRHKEHDCEQVSIDLPVKVLR